MRAILSGNGRTYVGTPRPKERENAGGCKLERCPTQNITAAAGRQIYILGDLRGRAHAGRQFHSVKVIAKTSLLRFLKSGQAASDRTERHSVEGSTKKY